MAEGEYRGFATLKGCLSKRSTRHYVVLQDSTIYAFYDETMQRLTGKLALGAGWDVRPIQPEKPKTPRETFCLRISETGPEKKKPCELLLSVSSGEESDRWLAAISFAIVLGSGSVFGVALGVDYARSSTPRCPFVVQRLIQHLESHDAASQSGVFRLSAAVPEVNKLRDAFNSGSAEAVESLLREQGDVNVVANALKLYLRELPQPLLTFERYRQLVDASVDPKRLAEVVKTLPKPNLYTLQYLMEYLVKVSEKAAVNMMTPQNLAIVFGPTIIRAEDEMQATAAMDSNRVNAVCSTMISNYEAIFGDVAKEAAAEKPRVRPAPITADVVLPIDSDEEKEKEKEKEKERKKKEKEEKEQQKLKEKEEKEKEKEEKKKDKGEKDGLLTPPPTLKSRKPSDSSEALLGLGAKLDLTALGAIKLKPTPPVREPKPAVVVDHPPIVPSREQSMPTLGRTVSQRTSIHVDQAPQGTPPNTQPPPSQSPPLGSPSLVPATSPAAPPSIPPRRAQPPTPPGATPASSASSSALRKLPPPGQPANQSTPEAPRKERSSSIGHKEGTTSPLLAPIVAPPASTSPSAIPIPSPVEPVIAIPPPPAMADVPPPPPPPAITLEERVALLETRMAEMQSHYQKQIELLRAQITELSK